MRNYGFVQFAIRPGGGKIKSHPCYCCCCYHAYLNEQNNRRNNRKRARREAKKEIEKEMI